MNMSILSFRLDAKSLYYHMRFNVASVSLPVTVTVICVAVFPFNALNQIAMESAHQSVMLNFRFMAKIRNIIASYSQFTT